MEMKETALNKKEGRKKENILCLSDTDSSDDLKDYSKGKKDFNVKLTKRVTLFGS